jgi:hypothetical protein
MRLSAHCLIAAADRPLRHPRTSSRSSKPAEKNSLDSQQISPLRSPGFPVETRGFDDLHAALFTESRIRGRR